MPGSESGGSASLSPNTGLAETKVHTQQREMISEYPMRKSAISSLKMELFALIMNQVQHSYVQGPISSKTLLTARRET